VKEAYPDQPIDPPTEMGNKRTKYYEKKFKELYDIGFGKKRVGEALKRLLIEGRGDEQSLESLKNLKDMIMERMERQTKARGAVE
jgi:hypothetical protein